MGIEGFLVRASQPVESLSKTLYPLLSTFIGMKIL